MPNTNRPLPIRCPKCPHLGCTLVVRSLSVITVKCASCSHEWATTLQGLPAEIQEKVRDAALEELAAR